MENKFDFFNGHDVFTDHFLDGDEEEMRPSNSDCIQNLRERIWKKKKSHFLTFRYYLWQLVSVFMAQKILLCLTRWHLSRIAIDTQQYRGFTSILSNFGRLLCTFLTPNGIYMLHSDMCYCTYMINHDIKGARKQQSDDHIQQVWSGGQ